MIVVSCGGGLSGKYESGNGLSLEFQNSKVLMGTSLMGITNVVELDYRIDGDSLKLTPEKGQASVVYKILPDGSIEGPLGIKFIKKN